VQWVGLPLQLRAYQSRADFEKVANQISKPGIARNKVMAV
jgi:hypothetical protein